MRPNACPYGYDGNPWSVRRGDASAGCSFSAGASHRPTGTVEPRGRCDGFCRNEPNTVVGVTLCGHPEVIPLAHTSPWSLRCWGCGCEAVGRLRGAVKSRCFYAVGGEVFGFFWKNHGERCLKVSKKGAKCPFLLEKYGYISQIYTVKKYTL